MDTQTTRREMVAPTERLVRFLRELARSGQRQVTDVADYELVRWLAELGEPDVGIDLSVDAGPGEVLFSIDPVPFEPAPTPPPSIARWLPADRIDVSTGPCPELSEDAPAEAVTASALDAYDDWAARWEVWAEHDRRVARRRSWFDTLARVTRRLEQQDDVFELVVGTGLLTVETDRVIRHPLLTTPAALRTDAETGRIDVHVADRATTRLVDRQLLERDPDFQAARAEVIRDQLRQEAPRPLADGNKELLTRWRSLALDTARPYEHEWAPPDRVERTVDLRFAPVLIFRTRDRTSLVDYFDDMLEALNQPGAEAPLGLAQLLMAIEPEDRLAWLESEGASSGDVVGGDPLFPLDSNPEQRQIVTRLTADNGVVVQGPPGTGKTHTIANLLSALLAKGQRVLVTSQKAQALRVLREKLPADVRELCVSLTDVGRGGSAELDAGVTALCDRYGRFSEVAHEQEVGRLRSTREAARRDVARLKEGVRQLRESETYKHPPVATGYAGTVGEIAEHVRRDAPACGWMPVPFPDEAPFDPPLPLPEFVELRRLLAGATPERRARSGQVIPDIGQVPTRVAVDDLIATEAAATTTARQAVTEASTALSAIEPTDLTELQQLTWQALEAMHALDLDPSGVGWASTWHAAIIRDGFSGQDMWAWTSLAEQVAGADAALQGIAGAGLREVSLPPFAESGPNSLAGQLEAAGRLRAHLAAGNVLRRRMRPAVQRQAAYLLDGALVDGLPITSVELLDLVIARLEAHRTERGLRRLWAGAGVSIDASHGLERSLALLAEHASRVQSALRVVAAHAQAAALLARRRTLLPLRTPEDWATFVTALDAVKARIDADDATRALQQQVARLEADGTAPTAPPELAALAHALAARDSHAYGAAYTRLANAPSEQAEQLRADALLSEVHSAHPVLAELLRDTAASDEWAERLPTFPDAWAWGRARTFFEQQRREGLEELLARKLRTAIDRVQETTAQLAAEEAWGQCLRRMTAHQQQALQSYQAAIGDRGGGSGKWAHRYAEAARQAMVEARDAVPAWIMPLREVIETIPPKQNCFDVVIVDEASQAGIEALFLLWLAPRVIVVGDERQCAPGTVGRGQLQPVFDRLDDYLGDVPQYLRMAFTPKNNLFGLLATRFSSPIRLREHFRCMPEIIEWSSSMFYADAPLVPLRQFGADRLPPLRSVYVPGAVTTGSSSTLANEAEAEAIVDRIKACIADPAYAGKTFGVVVLQGHRQVRLIDDLLQAEVPQVERERRRLRVGGPPDFQGDERNVVFVSMVVADRRNAVRSRDWQRRFNVAASRAQDQMWLFHSVTVDLLSPQDLRRSLLSYVQNPPAPQQVDAFDDLDWDSECRRPFDSVFEQRVYTVLRDRGYHVTPQVEVNGRRIDLVVTGAKGRLAIECDGDFWHASREAQEADVDRQLELERAGWQFWRVRESAFYFDPESALLPLWESLARRGIHPGDLKVQGDSTLPEPDRAATWRPIDLLDEDAPLGPDDEPPEAEVDVWDLLTPASRPAPTPMQATAPARSEKRHSSTSEAVTPREVRAWAQSLGLPVGERGRLAPAVVAAWNSAHPERPVRSTAL